MNKKNISDLGLLGGEPLFFEALHVGRPNLLQPERILEDVQAIFDSRWLTNRGPYVQRFEAELCRLLGVKHCIAVCNATLGLMLIGKALGLCGDVIVPSFTFPATVHALEWLGLRPVFCDIDPLKHTLSVQHVAELITEQTSAILGVHLWGSACDIEALQALADQHKIALIFDAAHALACTYQGQWIGGFGEAEVFSFHATKFINALEGGAITTNSDSLAKQLRQWINFGYDEYAEVQLPGINAKMNEVSAAVGLNGLASLQEIVAMNKAHYLHYQQIFSELPGFRLYPFPVGESCNYQYVLVEINAEQFGLSRDQVWKLLSAENILVRRYFYPACHTMRPYASLPADLPVTDRVSEQVLAFPTGTGISATDIDSLGLLLHWLRAHGVALSALEVLNSAA